MRLRTELGFTADLFARVIGVHRVTLYRWEAEGRKIDGAETYRVEHPRAVGTRPLLWLLSLSSEERVREGKWIRRLLAKGEDVACHLFWRARGTR